MGQRMSGGVSAGFRHLVTGWLVGSMLGGGIAEAQFSTPNVGPVIVAPDGSIPGRGGYPGGPDGGRFAGPGVRSVASERLRRPMTARDVQPRGTINLNGGNGLGYDNGFASFGGFIPFALSDADLIFVDGRGYTSFEEQGGANLGAGVRKYLPEYDVLFGISAWADVDAGNESLETFYRAGVSGEMISRWIEIRANGYFPVDDESFVVSDGLLSSTPFFQGNQIKLFNQTQTIDQFGGFDVEFGGPAPLLARYGTSVYFGGYYLNNDDPAAPESGGFQFRLSQRVNENVEVGMRLTQDNIFDTNVWVTADIRSPRGSWWDWFKGRWFGLEPVSHRFDYEVERNYRIPTDVRTEIAATPLIDPKDGDPYLVQHVAPAGTEGVLPLPPEIMAGPGTADVPFASFAAADADPFTPGVQLAPGVDIVFVDNGPGGTSTFATAGTIFMADHQRLLGRSESHAVTSSNFGTIAIAGLADRTRPVLSNVGTSNGPVIQIANNTEVSGFAIDGGFTNAAGFPGNRIGVLGLDLVDKGNAGTDVEDAFDINRNTITNVTGGIAVTYRGPDPATGVGEVPGSGVVANNDITGIGQGTAFGIRIEAIATPDGPDADADPDRGPADLRLAVVDNTITSVAGEDGDGDGVLGKTEDVTGPFGVPDSLLDDGAAIDLLATGPGAVIDATTPGLTTFLGTPAGTDRDGNGTFDGVAGNVSTSNGKGLRITASEGGVASVNSFGNTITGSTTVGSGVRVIATDIGSVATVNLDGETLSNNAGTQIGVSVDDGARAAVTLDDSTLTAGAGQAGVELDVEDATLLFAGTGNTITGADGAPGIDASIDDGLFVFDFGTPFVQNGVVPLGGSNTVSGFAGAGIGIELAGDTVAEVRIRNNTINSIGDDGDALTPFDGDGIYLGLLDNAYLGDLASAPAANVTTIDGLVPSLDDGDNVLTLAEVLGPHGGIAPASLVRIATPFLLPGVANPHSQVNCNFIGTDGGGADLGNAGDGIEIAAGGDSLVAGLVIGNETDAFGRPATDPLAGPTDNNDGNEIANNTDNGIEISTSGSADIDDLRIFDNTVTANGDGVFVSAVGSATTAIVSGDNEYSGNTDDGLEVFVQSDGQIEFDATNDNFNANGGSGIETAESSVSPTDQRSFGGTLAGIEVAENGADGIFFGASSNLSIVANGTERSVIALNQLDGIDISGAGTVNVSGTDITQNGQGVTGPFVDDGHGINYDGPSFNSLNIDNVLISENAGDGIEFTNDAEEFSVNMTVTNSEISDNGGRGVDILSVAQAPEFGPTVSTVAIDGTTIRGNGLQGVYLVNTASTDQDQNSAAGVLTGDGAVNTASNLTFSLTDSVIANNGNGSDFETNGLVMFIGTMDTETGADGANNPGFFATNGLGTFLAGGVFATVNDNAFFGNAGEDLFAQGFVSTVDPAAIGGTFDETTFDIDPENAGVADEYQSDPLARLDLVFNGNTFQTTDFNNVGASYSNADPAKSFPNDDDNPATTGPFDSDTRLRNAQRLALPTTSIAAGNSGYLGPDGPAFDVPGLGQSTFRVDTIDAAAQFIFDDDPYLNETSANGVTVGDPSINNIPFGWTDGF